MGWLNLTRDKTKPKTTGRRLTSLRAFAKWSNLSNTLDEYVYPKAGRGVPHPIPEGIQGIARMVAVCKNGQQSAIVGLCGFVGTRISEARSIQIPDIDLHEMLVTIRGKGDKTRVVPLSDRAWSAISTAYVEAHDRFDDYLVTYSDRTSRRIVTALGRRAQLERRISSHDLRMTFGTVAYDHSLDIRAVQELLGHSSSDTTQLYTQVNINKLRSAVNF